MSVWILTTEFNDYDQYGEYYVACFSGKPTWKQLMEHGVPQTSLRHVMNGGGRKPWEDQWFHLKEIEPLPATNQEKTP